MICSSLKIYPVSSLRFRGLTQIDIILIISVDVIII